MPSHFVRRWRLYTGKNKMNREHLFQFGRLDFLDYYAVITCNEGANVDFNEIHKIEEVLHRTYQGQRFGLIANRENRYSVNPIAIKKLFSNEHLIAGAIVGHTDLAKENAELENEIVEEVPIRFFFNMDSAIKWINDIVRED